MRQSPYLCPSKGANFRDNTVDTESHRMPAATFDSPVGPLTVTEEAGAIVGLSWRGAGTDDTPLLRAAQAQLTAYFQGAQRSFDLPLAIRGSKLQQQVCAQMQAIPWGDTRTYGDIATALGVPAQAVGQACGGNPIAVIVPCHRVLGASTLGGFSGGAGVETKVWLLRHEGAAGLLL